MVRAIRFLLACAVLGVLFFFSLLFVGTTPKILPLLVCVGGVAEFFAAAFFPRAAALVLGSSICLLPMFGPGVLNAIVVCWVLGSESRRAVRIPSDFQEGEWLSEQALVLGFMAFFLVLFGGTLHTAFLKTDILLAQTVFGAEGVPGLIAYFLSNSPSWAREGLQLISWAVAFCFTLSFIKVEHEELIRDYLFIGLAVGSLLACAVLAMQIAEIHPIFSANRSAFWQLTGRYPASFADPNAFGISAVLLVPALLLLGEGRIRRLCLSSGSLLLVAAAWSGSRTLALGLGLWALVGMLHFWRSRWSTAGIVTTFVATVALFAATGYPPLNTSLQERFDFPSARRVLSTLNWDDAASMLESREIFAHLAFAAWRREPIVGLGIGRFYEEQEELASEEGIELGDWRDNANNFYLGILAEYGLLGFLGVMLAFHLFGLAVLGGRMDQENTGSLNPARILSVSRISLGVIAVLLVTGPHLDFDEVKLLFCYFLALGALHTMPSDHGRLRFLRKLVLLFAFAVPSVFILLSVEGRSERLSQGFYSFERGDIGAFRWTGKQARVALCRTQGGRAVFSLRALNPNISQKPLPVRIVEEGGGASGEILLRNNQWTQLVVRGKPSSDPRREEYDILVDRVWSPSEGSEDGDPRWLGVMLRWPEESCEKSPYE